MSLNCFRSPIEITEEGVKLIATDRIKDGEGKKIDEKEVKIEKINQGKFFLG